MGVPSTWNDEPGAALDQTMFRSGFEARKSDIFIAVMGVTGSGKSTFISMLANAGAPVKIGHGLQGCTQLVTPHIYKYSKDVNVYLIDTPGFDDTNRDDANVLKQIAVWLSDSLKNDVKLSGIMYMHRITDTRMAGSAKRNLLMFKKLCGNEALKNVILVTTMWEKVTVAEGAAREKELIDTDDFWGFMVKNKSRVERHYNNRDSARALVTKFLKEKKVELTIQDEMVRKERHLDQTDAGKTLDSELAKERDKWKEEAARQKADREEALRQSDEHLAHVLEEERKKSEAKAKDLQKQREMLQFSLEELRRQADEKRQEMLLEQQQRLKDLKDENDKMLLEQQQKLKDENEKQMLKLLENQKLQIRELQAIRDGDQSARPLVRSHPGKNLIHECRSITLVDDSYFFCGPTVNKSNLPPKVKLRLGSRDFDDTAEHDSRGPDGKLETLRVKADALRLKALSLIGYSGGIRAFALGTSDSYYCHYHQGGHCKDVSFLPDYPELARWLAKHRQRASGEDKTESGCPRYVSLGANGHFFLATSANNCVRSVPADLSERWFWQHHSDIKAVWLGMDDAWVVQLKNGEKYFDLKGHYGGNDGELADKINSGFGKKRAGQRIKAMALNLANPKSFAAVWGDGGILYGTGGKFDAFTFEEYATKNFGTKFL